jgi:uncharacterized protein with PIN domain
MRTLVEPTPIARCGNCGGELRLKAIEPAVDLFERDREVWVCAECGGECYCSVPHDKYAPTSKVA